METFVNDRDIQTPEPWQRFHCPRLGKVERGKVRRYIERVSGLSLAQMTRLDDATGQSTGQTIGQAPGIFGTEGARYDG